MDSCNSEWQDVPVLVGCSQSECKCRIKAIMCRIFIGVRIEVILFIEYCAVLVIVLISYCGPLSLSYLMATGFILALRDHSENEKILQKYTLYLVQG